MAGVGVFALLFAALSLRWPVLQDVPILLYEGFLLHDEGLVPYRDFFDVNAPGTILLFSSIHQLTAGSQLACRLLDLSVLAAIAALTALALRRHGYRTGILAAASFCLLYLSTGPENSLQREYLCLLPLAASLALIFGLPEGMPSRLYPFFLCGMLAGLVATIKPPLVLCWLPLLAYAGTMLLGEAKQWRKLVKPALFCAFGGLLPIFFVVLWLYLSDALAAYIDIARNYYPLYTRIDGNGMIQQAGLAGWIKRYFLMTTPILAGPLAIVAFLGVAAGWNLEDKKLWGQNAALAVLVLCALIYVPVSGKFWFYHKIPIFYAMSLCAGIAFSRALPVPERAPRLRALTLMLALVASLPFAPFAIHFMLWKDGKTYLAPDNQVAQMVDYLRRHTTPEDTIAPLDTSTGALNALYQVRRPLYGRFLNDFHFYHDGTTPYIDQLRREFLAQFRDGKPSVLLQCTSWRPRGQGADGDFPELDNILRSEYVPVLQASDCTILRHR